MAKFFKTTRRKRFLAFSALALSATLSLGLFAACGGTTDTDEDDTVTPDAPTDVQTIKNGNFEFFAEMTEDDLNERRNLINSPNSWTISTVSPATDTKSGIIDTSADGWKYLAKTGHAFTSVADAYANWESENVTAYDRLKFLNDFDSEIDELASTSAEKKLFDEYSYSIDYEDVEKLNEDFPDGISLHPTDEDKEADGTHILMLHNTEKSDGVLGTAQYCTSSTTITLKGGTAAKVSVWVMTDKLYHYYDGSDPAPVETEGGAYIGVTNTVGGDSSSAQLRIRNINTKGAWEQYTVYIRANTFATTTYRLVLGLGENTSSDNRLEGVNGYAFFDDVVAETISDEAYKAATSDELLPADVKCGLNSDADHRKFDATDLAAKKAAGTLEKYDRTFAFDLLDDKTYSPLLITEASIDVTKETSGALTVSSKVPDNRGDDGTAADKKSYAEATTYAGLQTAKDTNGYLENIFANDFEGKFPFYNEDGEVATSTPVLMLLSTNGAAYTAKLEDEEFSLAKDEYMLISFFVKTSKIRTGKSGASVTLVDGENRTTISAFDSTTVATVDIDDDNKDIYKGWVQCFFLVKNESDGDKTFSLEFNYGPTSIVGSTVSDYADGYAAFADFRYTSLNKKQAGYLSTGSYSKSVTLTEYTKDSTQFDSATAPYDIEKELAKPANFKSSSADDTNAGDIVTGLLNSEYKANYYTSEDEKLAALKSMPLASGVSDADGWWSELFGDVRRTGRVATQPLVIYNKGGEAAPSFGYQLKSYNSSISANTTQRISMRLKVASGTTAYLYLTDLADVRENGFDARLTPILPAVTYWYDDDGNIVKGDPSAEDFDKKTDTLFYKEENGLYTRAGATGEPVYYANLHNFDTDDKGNLVTTGENSQIVYYKNENDETDTKFYAYRTEKADKTYEYTQPVEPLPTELEIDGKTVSITRYTAPADPDNYKAVIAVPGTADNTWVEVSFYIRTGNEAKSYLLELWAGKKGDTAGLPAGGYVFADNYKSEGSFSNYDATLSERVSLLADTDANLVDPEDAGSNLTEEHALYYTFSFYDSGKFVRYDKTQDTESAGDPWVDYLSSAYSESIVWLKYDTLDAAEGLLTSELFIDFSVAEQTVDEHIYNTDTDTDTDDDESTGSNQTNIWLIISSAVLAVALIFAIVAVIVRRLWKQHNRGKVKVVKDKPAKQRKAPKGPKAPKEKTPADENDPYNE